MVDPHVLIIPSWYPTPAKALSGIFIQHQARALSERLNRVGVIYCARGRMGRSAQTLTSLSHGFPEVIRVQWHPWRIWLLRQAWLHQYQKAYHSYRQMYGPPDLLHAHGYFGGVAARWIAQQDNLPYIVTEHSTGILSGQITANYRILIKKVYRDATMLIAVWKPLANAMRRISASNKVVVVP
ncbi:MAG: glycosyltransferase, partial [Saprospiraceae bacterium]|nr:glycosyltransferase [Saprospiraceae bacterium]